MKQQSIGYDLNARDVTFSEEQTFVQGQFQVLLCKVVNQPGTKVVLDVSETVLSHKEPD